jgi:hypothetical protein
VIVVYKEKFLNEPHTVALQIFRQGILATMVLASESLESNISHEYALHPHALSSTRISIKLAGIQVSG